MDDNNSTSEKTEQPTDKRRRDARERGQVAQAKDLNLLVGIFTLSLALYAAFNTYWRDYGLSVAYIFRMCGYATITTHDILQATWGIITTMLHLMLLLIVTAASVSLLVNIIQVGGIQFSKEAFKFDFAKLNIVSNFKSLFSKESFIKLLLQITITAIALIVVGMALKIQLPQLLISYNYHLPSIMVYLMSLISRVLLIIFLIYIVFGFTELILEKSKLTKQLMMTKEDLKRESKDTDGNPEVKYERRRLHREIIDEEVADGALANATMVIANPTHIAIVILYNPKDLPLPVVLIKAVDKNAQTIIKIAKTKQIPVFIDKWLARQLYSYTNVGEFIPVRLLGPVADIIGKNIRLLPKVFAQMQQMQTLPKPEVATSIGK